MKKKRILLLFSDTGGGHRSAAEAIIEALHLEYPGMFTTEMVDFFKDYAPAPFNKMPDLYPQLVKAPQLWQAGFYATDGRARARVITSAFRPYATRAARKLLSEHPSDVIVTTHLAVNSIGLWALGKNRERRFVSVVTDPVTTHALWFDKRADLILVPTEYARERAIDYHMPPEIVHVVGQPVADRYCAPPADRRMLREKLGWPQKKIIVALVGGGDGMGPIEQTARAIDESGLNVALVIVAGRNDTLKKKLDERAWTIRTEIHGFTRDLPDFFRAADALITKAGPGTIAEALNAGLPIILNAKLPGQEDGNVTYVQREQVGVWAPTPQRVVQTLTRWVTDPAERRRIAANCRRVARPDAARRIARFIAEQAGIRV
ncbi:MAG: Processive diacylglycerol beta-glucosyltransferase [Anaerolineales bacterium]|nr:Processive diacylglycerol beta-glucosyltransferase [Anaerolineales bacterium]